MATGTTANAVDDSSSSPTMPFAILVCDDHRVFADSLAVALESRGYSVVTTYDPAGAVAAASAHRFDLCLIDRRFPSGDGIAAVSEIRAASPTTKAIVLSGDAGPDAVEAARAAGANAVLSKDETIDRMVIVINQVVSDRFDPDRLFTSRAATTRKAESHPMLAFLTARERDVLMRLGRGQDTASMARDMGISYATARTHIQNLLTKLNVHSKAAAVALADKNGVFDRPMSRQPDEV